MQKFVAFIGTLAVAFMSIWSIDQNPDSNNSGEKLLSGEFRGAIDSILRGPQVVEFTEYLNRAPFPAMDIAKFSTLAAFRILSEWQDHLLRERGSDSMQDSSESWFCQERFGEDRDKSCERFAGKIERILVVSIAAL